MSSDTHGGELGRFLKSRRAALTPAAVGLPDTGQRRRVPGLRREEVAQLAAISDQYYTRVEQGRLQASTPVLNALAEVLRLNEDQRNYLFELAGKYSPPPRLIDTQTIRPQTRRLLDALGFPAIILGHRMDILAWNQLAAILLTDFSQIPQTQRNYARLVFSDSEIRSRYADWDSVAPECVAFLRMEAAHAPDDPELSELVDDLSAKDPHFRQWWSEHQVATQTGGAKTIRHPLVGELTLDWETLSVTADPNQQLVVWTAEPGTASYDGLVYLGSLVADRDKP